MTIQRITQPEPREDGIRAEPVVEHIMPEPSHLSLKDRQEARLREAALNREAAGRIGYANLQRGVTREPLTAEEADMAEKSPEQRKREAVNTSGDSFNRIQEQQQEKLEQENAVTAHAGITKVGQGAETRLIPTVENYTKEPGERSEGVPVPDINPLSIVGPGIAGHTKMDEAELKLSVGNTATASHAKTATGSSAATDVVAAVEQGNAPDGSVRSDEEVEKLSEGSEATKTDSKTSEEGKEPQKSRGKFSGTAEELERDYTRDQLEQEATKRGLTVSRSDGSEGAPLKSDFAKALAQ